MELSVIVPVYNERQGVAETLSAILKSLPSVSKEVIVVDDGSTDGSAEWLRSASHDGSWLAGQHEQFDPDLPRPNRAAACFSIRVHYHARNLGKGAALQSGLALATGDVIVIQDADLEYDPADWETMYDLIAVRRVADVVYGSRFYGRPHRSLYYHHYLANRLISILFNALYNQTLTDVEVCYKMFTRPVAASLALTCNDFGVEIQLSAQIALARRWRIYEVGVSYYGRTYAEGKKINWRDGIRALWYLVRFRWGS